MRTNWKLGKRKFRTAAFGITTGLLVSGCDISAEAQKAINSAFGAGSSPTVSTATHVTSVTGTATCHVDTFTQPAAQISHSVDILFVADTSGSMAPKRAKVADALYAFVGALPPGTDYRIGVVLAHGSNDPNSGRLYANNGNPKVLDSSTASQATIQQQLKDIMLAAPDYNNEQGEMGSYALIKALSPAKLAESRALGFFRTDAALAVINISDENDLCAVYPSPLPANYNLTSVPFANMPGMTSPEKSIRDRDCSSGYTTDDVINAIKNVQGDRPYAIGAVIHNDVNYKDSGGNDSYNWGFAQVVDASHGVTVDIGDANFSSGLSTFGALTTTKLNLLSDFTLMSTNVDASTIKAFVDRIPARHDYSASQNEVHLYDLGQALSDIEIQYCENAPVVTSTSTTTSTSTDTGTSTGTSTSTGTGTSTSTGTTTSTGTSTSTATAVDWDVAGFDGTTTSNSATLIWQTSGMPTTATLQVGLTPSDLTYRTVSLTNSAETQLVTVSGLDPNTQYYFQVTAIDANGASHTSVMIMKATKP